MSLPAGPGNPRCHSERQRRIYKPEAGRSALQPPGSHIRPRTPASKQGSPQPNRPCRPLQGILPRSWFVYWAAPVAHRTAHRSRRRVATCTCGTSDGTQVAAEGGYLHLWHIGRHIGRGGGRRPAPVSHRTAHRSRRRQAICTCGTTGGTQVAAEAGYLHLWHTGRHTGRGYREKDAQSGRV